MTTGYPFRNGQREHRIVAAKKLGRPLRKGECVHHINGDKTDNRPENLRVYSSNAEHMLDGHLGGVWTPAMDRKLLDMKAAGAKAREIAAALGVSLNCVNTRQTRLRKYGVPVPAGKPGAPPKHGMYLGRRYYVPAAEWRARGLQPPDWNKSRREKQHKRKLDA